MARQTVIFGSLSVHFRRPSFLATSPRRLVIHQMPPSSTEPVETTSGSSSSTRQVVSGRAPAAHRCAGRSARTAPPKGRAPRCRPLLSGRRSCRSTGRASRPGAGALRPSVPRGRRCWWRPSGRPRRRPSACPGSAAHSTCRTCASWAGGSFHS